MTNDALIGVVGTTGPILLDFDGPVCGVFAGYSAPDVAIALRALLDYQAVSIGPVRMQDDPLEILRWTATLGNRRLTQAVEEELRAAELQAVRTASPTKYAREVVVAAAQTGRPVAIVSNNSEDAIRAYADQHRLAGYIGAIVGRPFAEPERMKPNPDPVFQAIKMLDAESGECVLIGDSVTDIEAAHAAGVRSIGYANKDGKAELFAAAGVGVIVTSMADIARELLATES